MSDTRDALFGEVAVELALVTEAQLAEAFDAQKKAAELAGLEVDLVHVLGRKGWLSPEREEELRAAVAIRTGEARLIGDYEVVSKLGQGGMGAVYEAKHVNSGLRVALKILPPSMADEESIARFKREAEIVNKLDHENIVGSVEFGYDTKRKCHFCALELVEGECLDAIIERRSQMPQSEALDIARQIAQALQHAHFSGLVHRDVKPENIMITPGGAAKLLDLGLARRSGGKDARVTQEGHFVGSPHYASPEQAMGRNDIDVRSDIYSLGATLYHMVTGRPPFEGDNPAEVLQAHIHDEFLWPSEMNEDLTDDVCWLIAKMMAKSPELRYREPKEIIRDIDLLMRARSIEIDREAVKLDLERGGAKSPQAPPGSNSPKSQASKGKARKPPTAGGGSRQKRLVGTGRSAVAGKRMSGRNASQQGITIAVILIAAALIGTTVMLVARSRDDAEHASSSSSSRVAVDTPRTVPGPHAVAVAPAPLAHASEVKEEPHARAAFPGAARDDEPSVRNAARAHRSDSSPQHVFDGHRYELLAGAVTWEEASELCEARGGHLVTVTSENERQYVVSLASRLRGDFWIGLFDPVGDGTWVWVTAEPTALFDWAEGEPSGDGRYVNLLWPSGYHWNDDGRLRVEGFICEWDSLGSDSGEGAGANAALPADINRALVGYWRFDEGAGSGAFDGVGELPFAKFGAFDDGAGPSWVPGRSGTALEFDGRDDCLELGTSPLLDPEELTVSAWIAPDSITTPRTEEGQVRNEGQVFSRGRAQIDGFYGIMVNYEHQRPEAWLRVGGKLHKALGARHSLTAGEWTHIAMTYDGATMKLYTAGRLAGLAAIGLGRSREPQAATIGREGSQHPFIYGYAGKLDEMRFYGRALSDEEIREVVGKE